MFRRIVTAATIASLLAGTRPTPMTCRRLAMKTKLPCWPVSPPTPRWCSTPQSKIIQDLKGQLLDDEDLNIGDVRVKAADYTVEAALDNAAWCAKTDKYFAKFEKVTSETDSYGLDPGGSGSGG